MSQTLAAPATAGGGACPATSPQFLLRVGGLPLDALGALDFEATRAWADEVLGLESELRDGREQVVELLHDGVQAYAHDAAIQRALIALKRDAFNLRAPKPSPKLSAAVAALGGEARARIESWLELNRRRSALLGQGEPLVDDELARKRAALKSILRDEDFRKGLLLASPTLEKDLTHYLAAPDKKLNRRLRLAERAALLYLFRTACKTSPFSTFGSVTVGHFDDAPPPGRDLVSYQTGTSERESFVRVNVAFLSKLTSLMLSNEAILRTLPLSLTPRWEMQGGRIRYLRHSPAPTEITAGPLASMVNESVFSLPLSPTLRRLIEFMGESGEYSLGEISAALGGGEDSDEGSAQIEEFLVQLVRLDFLAVNGLHPSPYSADPLGEYRRRLAEVDSPATNLICSHLGELQRLAGSYGRAPLDGRRSILTGIEQEMWSCYAAAGGDGERPPKTILYEDTTLHLPRLSIAAAGWQGYEASLKDVQRLLPMYELMLAPRLVMSAFFKVIYGAGRRCDDVLSFAEVFTQDYYSEYRRAAMRRQQKDVEGNLAPSLNHFRIPEIRALDELQQDFADYVGQELLRLPAGGVELRLSREAVKSFAERMPDNLGRLSTHSFFSQLARVGEESLLVINRAYGGLTQMFSRFIAPLDSHGMSGMHEELRGTLEALQPPGAVFAEVQAGQETNLNLHPLLARYELVCPGERSSRPAAEQLHLGDLYIEHDPTTDSLHLRSRRLQKEVIPVYLGFLVPMALPQLRQVLVNFGFGYFGAPYYWGGVKTGPKIGKTFAFYPRIRYEDIILQRAMWKVAPEFLPRRAPAESDASYFLSVKRWQQQCGLPRRVFVTPDSLSLDSGEQAAPDDGPKPEQASEGKPAADFERLISKPMYIDFDNFFSVLLFERLVTRTTARTVLTEMLPDREHQWYQHQGQSYVTEFIFEINQASRRCS